MTETTHSDGEYYPVRDKCTRYEDPPEGCYLTEALYYTTSSLIVDPQGVVYILGKNSSQIAKIMFKSNITYVLNRNNLNCDLHLWVSSFPIIHSERCSTFCNQLHGIWNVTHGLCHIELFIQSICIRVRRVDGTWILDTDKFVLFLLLIGSERHLPTNRAFELYDSDGIGCSYSNNWHSVMYSYRKTLVVPVLVILPDVVNPKIRSSADSYLFASAYTRGCSSDTRVESSCFGEPRLVRRHVFFVLFVITFLVCILETVFPFLPVHCSALFCSSFLRKRRSDPPNLPSCISVCSNQHITRQLRCSYFPRKSFSPGGLRSEQTVCHPLIS